MKMSLTILSLMFVGSTSFAANGAQNANVNSCLKQAKSIARAVDAVSLTGRKIVNEEVQVDIVEDVSLDKFIYYTFGDITSESHLEVIFIADGGCSFISSHLLLKDRQLK